MTDKPLFMTDKSLFMTDKPLFMTDKPLFMTDKSLFMTDKSFLTNGLLAVNQHLPMICPCVRYIFATKVDATGWDSIPRSLKCRYT
jgi:hypothetical protein